jgi:hypothetical protein
VSTADQGLYAAGGWRPFPGSYFAKSAPPLHSLRMELTLTLRKFLKAPTEWKQLLSLSYRPPYARNYSLSRCRHHHLTCRGAKRGKRLLFPVPAN